MEIDREILKRFFDGNYSRKDNTAVQSYFNKYKDDTALKDALWDQWIELESQKGSEKNIDHLLNGIHRHIESEQEQTGSRPIRFITVFQRIAAIMLLPLLLSFFAVLFTVFKDSPKTATAEIQCPPGVRTKFVLPDGTNGYLSGGSTLAYPVTFSKQRTVTLSGEAFFDVTRDAKHPFTVNTPHLSTKVLGTRFNVVAYGDENTEQIILQEGKVDVYLKDGEKIGSLLPDNELVYNSKTNTYFKDEVEAQQYISWTEGKLAFRDEALSQVADRISRWYNVDMEIADKELLAYTFRATFIDEPIEEVLKLLAITSPITYTIEDRKHENENINNTTNMKKKVVIGLDRTRLDAF